MKFVVSIVLLLCSSASFAQKPTDVVAQVGKKTITVQEFNKKYNDVRSQTVNPPSKEQFLEDLIRFEMGVQEAYKKNLQKDPVVQDRFEQEMYKMLLEKDIGNSVQNIKVSEADMKKWYSTSPELRSSQILIEYKAGATAAQIAEAKKRAEEILKEVKSSKRPFEELVKLYSDDALSKPMGGDIGWQSKVTLVPAYYDTLSGLKVGEISGLVSSQYGFHIIKLTGKRTYENANKRQIRAAVFDEKRRLIFNDYFEKLKKSYKINENKALIK